MDIGNIIILDIEKLNSEGAGLARYNNFIVFVKGACPADKLKCKITKIKKNYAEAEIVEILTPSPFRVEPRCKMQKICGGCELQHIEYNEQLNSKKIIVEDTLYSILGEKIQVKQPMTTGYNYGYRCKVQYPVRSKGRENSRLYAGYFKEDTHELVNIKYCPVHPEVCDNIIEFVKTEGEKLGVTGYSETTHSGVLRHIVLRFSNYNNNLLIVLVINQDLEIPDNIKQLAHKLYDSFKEIKGVAVNYNNKRTNVILGENTQTVIGENFIEEKLSDFMFKISADTFFQINPNCADLMFKYIKDYIANNFITPKLLDAYAGIATFGITMSELCKNVISVEINKQAVENAIETIKNHKITNIDVIASDSLDYVKQTKNCFDITILDPPRKGCGEEVLVNVLRVTKDTIIYVSCSPKSLAKDLKFLLENGCSIELIQPFDMFPNTPHIENVAIIKVNK